MNNFQELEKYCLGYQSLKSKQTDPALLEAREAYKEVLNYYKKSTTLKEKLSRLEVLHNMESHVKKTYLRTIIPFVSSLNHTEIGLFPVWSLYTSSFGPPCRAL